MNESHPVETRVELTRITDDQLALLVKDGALNPAIQQALRKILEQKDQIDSLNSGAEKHDTVIEGIYNRQQRLRENLKARKGSAEEKAFAER
jgi:hypothetical protein